MIKRALRQSPNLIIDSSRTNGKRIRDDQIRKFLIGKVRRHKQIKRMLFITRNKQIIDIKAMVWYTKIIEALHGAVCAYRRASFYG